MAAVVATAYLGNSARSMATKCGMLNSVCLATCTLATSHLRCSVLDLPIMPTFRRKQSKPDKECAVAPRAGVWRSGRPV